MGEYDDNQVLISPDGKKAYIVSNQYTDHADQDATYVAREAPERIKYQGILPISEYKYRTEPREDRIINTGNVPASAIPIGIGDITPYAIGNGLTRTITLQGGRAITGTLAGGLTMGALPYMTAAGIIAPPVVDTYLRATGQAPSGISRRESYTTVIPNYYNATSNEYLKEARRPKIERASRNNPQSEPQPEPKPKPKPKPKKKTSFGKGVQRSIKDWRSVGKGLGIAAGLIFTHPATYLGGLPALGGYALYKHQTSDDDSLDSAEEPRSQMNAAITNQESQQPIYYVINNDTISEAQSDSIINNFFK